MYFKNRIIFWWKNDQKLPFWRSFSVISWFGNFPLTSPKLSLFLDFRFTKGSDSVAWMISFFFAIIELFLFSLLSSTVGLFLQILMWALRWSNLLDFKLQKSHFLGSDWCWRVICLLRAAFCGKLFKQNLHWNYKIIIVKKIF